MNSEESIPVDPREVSELLDQWLSAASGVPDQGADALQVTSGRGTLTSVVGVSTSAVPVSDAATVSSAIPVGGAAPANSVAGSGGWSGFPVNAPLPMAPHTYTAAAAAPLFDVAREEQWEALVVSACGLRGPAVRALAGYLRSAQPALGRFQAAWMSVELLEQEPVSVCETLTVLIRDGWEGSLGGLLACARAL